jgi:hypothetical protein
VVDDSTGAPLPDAHVFLSGTLTGTTVSDSGRFRLGGVTAGAKRLYVTHVGYEARQVDLVLPPRDTTRTFSFRLRPTVVDAAAVTVSAPRDEEWYERLERFKRLFVGDHRWAAQCRLLNPTVLSFDTTWWGRFEASARRPLRFVNRALGYRLTYYLKHFEQRGDRLRWNGEPAFTALPPRDSAEAARWAANRREAFRGSLRHLMLALMADRVDAEQFRLARLPRAQALRQWDRGTERPISRDRLLSPASDSLYALDVRGALVVDYLGAPEAPAYLEWADRQRAPRSYQRSYIRLNQHPIHVDAHGELVEPYGATLYRYFAFRQRVSTLLPQEYRPPGTPLAATTPD